MQVANFDAASLNAAVAEFGPAIVIAEGKTLTEKRISVVKNGSAAVQMFAAAQKGKVGAAAREGIQMQGFAQIAHATRRGNYKPLAEALAILTAEDVVISSRAAYESLNDRYQPKLDALVREDKHMKGDKLTSKAAMYMQCITLINNVKEMVASIIANEQKGSDDLTSKELSGAPFGVQ